MKYLTILLLFFISCNNGYDYCDKQIHGTQGATEVGFMATGGILDKYDDGKVYYEIVKINNLRDWDFNEYFTGVGFSKDENDALKILDKDSCQLKQFYFEFLNNQE